MERGVMTEVKPDRLTDLKRRSDEESYRGFVCWDPSGVARIINPEAAAPSAEVLLATHESVPLVRMNVAEAGRLRPVGAVSESDVLDIVRKRHVDPLIVPIIGPSGSGKSHFVLWLRAQLEADPAPSRRLVYVEKGRLSLSSVVEELLMGEEGEEFDALRASVRDATEALTEEQAALRFRNELSYAIRNLSGEESAPDEDREYALDSLPALLDDHAYATHLLAADGALRRAVSAALGEKRDGEAPEARFEPGDLPLTLHGEEDKLGETARYYLAALGDHRQSAATYAVLNQVRDDAMRRVFGVEPNRLVRVMGDLRRRLFERDPDTEIVLMIEDFTLLQGVQYELLEAMLDLPTRGEQVMCEMRAVIAVTRDRFTEILAHSDTLRTRLQSQGHVYSIDLRVDDSDDDALNRDQLASFVARYLNAVRLGHTLIADRYPEVPNACEACKHRDRCHAGFGAAAGTGESKYGLYPFSSDVLRWWAEAHSRAVNPRLLLDTLRTTLVNEADAVRHARFPRETWGESLLPADPALRERIEIPFEVADELRRTESGDRRLWLQTYWSSERDALTDVDEAIHEAFAITPLGRRVRPEPKPGPEPEPRPRQPKRDPLQLWVSGGELPAGIARQLRKTLRDLIMQRAGGTTQLIAGDELERIFPDESIVIEGAAGGGRLGRDAIALRFDRSAATGVLFQQLQLVAAHGWSGADRSRLPEVLAAIDARAEEVDAFLDTRRQDWEAALPSLIPALAISGLTFGHQHGTALADILAGMAAPVEAPADNAEAWLGPGVGERVRNAHERGRQRMLAFATVARAVGGGAGAIDASALLPHLEATTVSWAIPAADAVPEELKPVVLALMRLETTLDQAHAYLDNWRTTLREAIGDGKELATFSPRLDRAGARVRRRGLRNVSLAVPPGYETDAPALLAAVDRTCADWPSLNLGEKIVRLLGLDRARLDAVLGATTTLRQELDAALHEARRATTGGRGDDATRLSARLASELTSLRDEVEALRDHSA
jgi:hypothetical protein